MAEITVVDNSNIINVTQVDNQVILSDSGIQGPSGRTILNGSGAPADGVGVTGDFYFDVVLNKFYGPKLTDNSWLNAKSIILTQEVSEKISWSLAQVSSTPDADGYYTVTLTTSLLFQPNVTVIDSGGNAFETGVQYNESNKTVKLFMTSRFSGTAYLS
jgi:hypothetical protein